MEKFVEDSELGQVGFFLESHGEFTDLLGKEWIRNNLLVKKERLRTHYLFWLLSNENEAECLLSWLQTIKESIPDTKFTGLINKLEKNNKKIEFYSLLSEIEVLAYYSSKKLELEYEPIQGDIKLIINNSEVYIEIAKLFSSKEQMEYDKLQNIVHEKIDKLDNPRKYIFSFMIPYNFSRDNCTAFVNFIDDISKEEFQKFPTESIKFNKTEAWIKILRISSREKGYVSMSMSPGVEVFSANRLKAKIKDESKQLPTNKLNVVTYNISDPSTHFESIEDAFYGQSEVRFNLVNGEPISSELGRKSNGVIHSEEGKQISALIAFYHFKYDKRRKYENPFAENKLPKDIFNVL